MCDYLIDIITTIIMGVLIAAIIAAMIFGLYKASAKYDDKLWNDGHCDVCGGTWQYEQAVGHKSSTSYIYVCEDCGKRIEINEMR